MIDSFDTRRIKVLKEEQIRNNGPVIYWMSREQRVNDNWALIFAQNKALKDKKQFIVVFCLVEKFLDATIRQYDFLLRGLIEVEKKLTEKLIPFYILTGNPSEKIIEFIQKNRASLLITDFDPLKIKKEWKKKISENILIPFIEVDSHNIVPCFFVSQKKEYGAYTLRPKILKLLPQFLTNFPEVIRHPFNKDSLLHKNNFEELIKTIKVDRKVSPLNIESGEEAAIKKLKNFINEKLIDYSTKRNDPSLDHQSGLSCYLHFGHISSQRVALEIKNAEAPEIDKKTFLEELIIRKELSDNFCYYDENYDNYKSFPLWAIESLNKHKKDRRNYIYTLEELENAKTHDTYWNAAQMEMVITGKMHGYMRMYWAKKILEWTESFEEAQKIAIYLNDKYELDGRDPNGYTGIAWSIGGVHDRPWGERKIFGKIRYMSEEGLIRKFKMNEYVKRIKNLVQK